MPQYVMGADGVVQLVPDGANTSLWQKYGGQDPQNIQGQGWQVVNGVLYAVPGSQPPADIQQAFRPASAQEMAFALDPKGGGAASNSATFADALKTGAGFAAAAYGAGNLLGSIGAPSGLTSAARTGLEAAEQGAANNTLSGVSAGDIPTYTASAAPNAAEGSLTVTDVPETGAATAVGTGGASTGPLSWITAANALPIAGAAGSIGSALIGASAAKNAANTISNAANNATGQLQGTQATINAQNAPFLQTGTAALKDIGAGAGLDGFTPSANSGITPGQFTHSFNADDLKTSLAPNYDFMLQQGLGAVQNQNNAAGGLNSGNTLKAINDYAQNYAGNAYQNAFNNYNANQTNIFNRLSSIAGLGQTANQTTASSAVPIANSVAGTTVGAAQANASGQVGAANAIGAGVNNALGWYTLNQLSNPQTINYG